MATAPIPLNCPKCPRALQYVTTTDDDIVLYRCSQHGEWQLRPGGVQRPPPASLARRRNAGPRQTAAGGASSVGGDAA